MKKPSGNSPPSTQAAPIKPTTVEPVRLRTADDVLTALELAVAEIRELLANAKAAGDLRLQNQLVQTLVGALDKLAKSVGLYSDGAVINVDQSTQRLEVMLNQLDDARLKALLSGEAVVNLLPEEPKLVERLAIETKERNDE